MPKAVTGRQAIQNLTSTPSQWTLGTVIETNVLARDKNNVILTSSRIVTVNYHGIGGLGRVELPTGIDPTNVSVNDDLLVLQQNGRALAVQHYPASNRTAAGSGGMGQTLALEKYSSDITVVGTIVGNQLELLWNPVPRAEYYQIWTSPTGDPAIDDATYVANSPSTSWVSKRDGIYFDDGMWYAVMAQHSNGQAGTLSPWVQPTFGGNYAHGLLSTNQTTSIPGSMVVTLGGSIVRSAFTAVDSPTTFTVDVSDPIGIHPSAWANGNILQFTDTSGNKLWVTISGSADETTFWRYTVTKNSPGAGVNYTIPSGSSVINWGASGQGAFIVSSDGTFGAGTLWAIVTHSGSPWSSFTVQVYADSTGKVLAAGGDIWLDVTGLNLNVGELINFYNGSTIEHIIGSSAPTNEFDLNFLVNQVGDGIYGSFKVDVSGDGGGSAKSGIFEVWARGGVGSYASLYYTDLVGMVISTVDATRPTPTGVLDLRSLSTHLLIAQFRGTSGSGSGTDARVELYVDDGAALASGDRLGNLVMGGANDNAHTLQASANVRGKTTEAWSGSASGSKIEVLTTKNTTNGALVGLTVDQDQSVVVNNAALATNATGGFLYIPSCAGPPTGTPVTNTGRVPMVYDSSNNDFYIYNGGWKKVHLA